MNKFEQILVSDPCFKDPSDLDKIARLEKIETTLTLRLHSIGCFLTVNGQTISYV